MYGLHGPDAKAKSDFSQLGGEAPNIVLCMFYNQVKFQFYSDCHIDLLLAVETFPASE